MTKCELKWEAYLAFYSIEKPEGVEWSNVINTTKIPLKCVDCQKQVMKCIDNLLRPSKRPPRCRSCGGKNGNTKEALEKYTKTMLERHGVTHPLKSENIKDKVRKTCEARYGKRSIYLARKAYKDKNAINPFLLPDFKEKSKDTMLNKYGVEHINQAEENRDNLKNRMLDIYGEASPLRHSLLQKNECATYLEFCHKVVAFLETEKTCCNSKLAEEHFQSNGTSLIVAVRTLGREDLVGSISSSSEDALFSFLSENYKGLILRNDRTILKPKELDFYFPDLKLAIEFHGLIWHSEKFKIDKNYHYNKYMQCKSQGIELIQIFEHEWADKTSEIKQFLINKLTTKKRVYARKCEVVNDINILKDFIKTNHIRGLGKADEYLGLSYQGVIVMAISIGKHHRGLDVRVLNRVCFKDVTVVGGLAKLLKRATFEKLVTWSDHRFSPFGNMYSNAGFTKEVELPPDYFYTTSNGIVYSKQSQMKSKTNCPLELSEREWNLQRGLYRVWDCGKTRWSLTRS